jgi:hypothetical protein
VNVAELAISWLTTGIDTPAVTVVSRGTSMPKTNTLKSVDALMSFDGLDA